MINPMPKKHYDQNDIRRQTYEESLGHHASVVQHYRIYIESKKSGGQECLIEVPYYDSHFTDSVQWRTESILNRIKSQFST